MLKRDFGGKSSLLDVRSRGSATSLSNTTVCVILVFTFIFSQQNLLLCLLKAFQVLFHKIQVSSLLGRRIMGMKIVLNEPKGNTIVNFLASFSRIFQSEEKKGFFSYLFCSYFLSCLLYQRTTLLRATEQLMMLYSATRYSSRRRAERCSKLAQLLNMCRKKQENYDDAQGCNTSTPGCSVLQLGVEKLTRLKYPTHSRKIT